MATLTIRNLPDEVHDALRRRAAEHRRSVEAEVREVLRAAALAGGPTPARRAEALAELRAIGARIKAQRPEGWLASEELIAERRLDAVLEDGRITPEERRAWADRLSRGEATPDEAMRFAASRL